MGSEDVALSRVKKETAQIAVAEHWRDVAMCDAFWHGASIHEIADAAQMSWIKAKRIIDRGGPEA